MKRVLVLGGSGFVGKALCRELIKIGAEVFSISRSGNPIKNPLDDPLLQKVNWIKGNALDSHAYSKLDKIDTLIHSIGILREPSSKQGKFAETFESEILDTLKVSLEASKKFGAPLSRIGYISAADFGFISRLLLSKYMKAKLEAEHLLESQNVPTIIARPGFMFGSDRFPTIPFSYAYSLLTLFSAGFFPKALDVNVVARALISNLGDENLSGVKYLEINNL
jgi:nucleoside-diphosphate-sugar epimerase